jgi:hypothetical protein
MEEGWGKGFLGVRPGRFSTLFTIVRLEAEMICKPAALDFLRFRCAAHLFGGSRLD